jgi:hypothetical protein
MNLLNFQILKSVGFALRTLKMGNLEVKEKAKENLPKNTPNPFIKKTGCRLLGVQQTTTRRRSE